MHTASITPWLDITLWMPCPEQLWPALTPNNATLPPEKQAEYAAGSFAIETAPHELLCHRRSEAKDAKAAERSYVFSQLRTGFPTPAGSEPLVSELRGEGWNDA